MDRAAEFLVSTCRSDYVRILLPAVLWNAFVLGSIITCWRLLLKSIDYLYILEFQAYEDANLQKVRFFTQEVLRPEKQTHEWYRTQDLLSWGYVPV